jgi:signal peptidase I
MGPGGGAPHRRRVPRLVLLLGVGYLASLAVNRSLVVVRGPSMEPSLWPGDLLFTLPAHRWWLRPGQVVVVAPPDGPGRVVKRVHRLERVDHRDHRDHHVDHRDHLHHLHHLHHPVDHRDHLDGEGHRWVVDVRGDTPERSTDSRRWGPLPLRRVRRVAVARWPDVRTRLRRRPADDPPLRTGP